MWKSVIIFKTIDSDAGFGKKHINALLFNKLLIKLLVYDYIWTNLISILNRWDTASHKNLNNVKLSNCNSSQETCSSLLGVCQSICWHAAQDADKQMKCEEEMNFMEQKLADI